MDASGQTVNPAIRQATPNDLGAVLAVDARGANPKRREEVRRALEQGHCWLAQMDDRVVGYLVADANFYGYPFVWLVSVVPAFRRRGVATALMTHAESLFSADKLFTSTNESNHASQRLMESLGYQRTGWIENLDEGDPEIVYVKRLA